jgi:beta-lactam-binding protein with PASTA domain
LVVAIVAVAVSAFALGRSGRAATPTNTTKPPVTTTPERSMRQVPDLIGLDQDSAMQVADALGFRTTRITQRSSTNPPTVVIAEHPAAGTQLPGGSTFEIVVSSLGP